MKFSSRIKGTKIREEKGIVFFLIRVEKEFFIE